MPNGAKTRDSPQIKAGGRRRWLSPVSKEHGKAHGAPSIQAGNAIASPLRQRWIAGAETDRHPVLGGQRAGSPASWQTGNGRRRRHQARSRPSRWNQRARGRSDPPLDECGDAGADVLWLRVHGRQERVEAPPRLVKLVHQRQHN